MGLILVTVLSVASGWTMLATIRSLRQMKAGCSWWAAFMLLLVAGGCIGAWSAFCFEYQVTSTMRFLGFPVPMAFFHLEHDHWIDFITPPHVMYPGLVANIAVFAALALLPLLMASRLAGKSRMR